MERLSLTRTLLFFLLLPCAVRSQTVWLDDHFDSQVLSDTWNRTDSAWTATTGGLRITTAAFDQLLPSSVHLAAEHPFRIEADISGPSTGVFFALDDPATKAVSQMVRRDGQSVLCGYITAGSDFVATSSFPLPPSTPDRIRLRVDVDPVGRTSSVVVDGNPIGVDSLLRFRAGYVGLQASAGTSVFHTLRVTGEGQSEDAVRQRNGELARFSRVRFVRAIGNGAQIYNPEVGLLQTIRADGTLGSQSRPYRAPRGPLQAMVDNRIFEIGRGCVLVRSHGRVIDTLRNHFVSPSAIVAVSRSSPHRRVPGSSPAASVMLLVADAGSQSVIRLSGKGDYLGEDRASIIGGFRAPRGIDVTPNGEVLVADYDRLVFLQVDAPDDPPKVEIDDGRGYVQWSATRTGSAHLEFAPDGGSWQSVTPEWQRGTCRATMDDLTPLTRYSFRFGPALRTIPGDEAVSRMCRFVTPPTDTAAMAVTRLPVLCMVYRTISYRDKYPALQFSRIPAGRTLSDEDLTTIRKGLAFNREFYFRNSSCRFVLDFDLFIVDDTLRLGDCGESDPYWLGPEGRVTKDYEHAVVTLGRTPTYYAGLIVPYAWVNYPASRTKTHTDTVRIRQAYGGGTNGVPAPWRNGVTTGFTSNPFVDRYSRQDWLIAHEFHHQIDALMEASGYPDYCHADMPWLMPGRFGEDFDFNAAIIRRAPVTAWLTLRFGSLNGVRDADHDGVPDDDPSLPFDERRLHGDPTRRDSEGDGLDDLHEVMAGSAHGTRLDVPDTDGDGLSDSIDPEPLYAVKPALPRWDAGHALGSRNAPSYLLRTADSSASLAAFWSDSGLVVQTLCSRPENVLIQIDADNDGWFHGHDNIQVRVSDDGLRAQVLDLVLRDCSSWSRPPRDRRDILPASVIHVHADSTRAGSTTLRRLTIIIPPIPSWDFSLRRGKTVALRFGVQTVTDPWVWDEFFERNYMMPVRFE